MSFVYYLQTGIMADSLPNGYDQFYVAENVNATFSLNRYHYPGDDIQNDLDSLCVELYDVFQAAIFPSQDDYYKDFEVQPQWITRAGLDSDFDMSRDQLEKCFSSRIQDLVYGLGIKDEALLQKYQEIDLQKFKYAYIADCQSLINTLQELICGCHSSLIGFYKHLCTLDDVPKMDTVYFDCGPESRMVYSFLYSLIIQIYSAFDILTKITYELENLQPCESAYAKLSSNKILYGDKKRLRMDVSGTVFEKCRTTSIIENLRNELVHNATWEMNPKVFIITDNGKITGRHIFLPDFTAEGTLVAFKNRKRFFADGKKVNEELPSLYFDVLQKMQVTLNRLLKKS